jgi:hypothetical protein
MTWRCEAADKLGEKVRSEKGAIADLINGLMC